jgi:2'-hydroxyisoflavone reductase
MRMLVLGGTRFVGLHVVEAALAAGFDVDVFSRGTSPVPAGVGHVAGDRDGDLSMLAGAWDVVVDVSGYLPRQVRASAVQLSERAQRYLFISTASVYDGPRVTPPVREDAPLKTLDDPATETITGETYGGLKVLCERAAEDAFAGEVLSIRPTFVVGPYDYTDRFTWWLRRVRRGGRMVAPIEPSLPLAFVDGRDLGRFTVALAESDAVGAVNASGPAAAITWGEALALAREVTGSDAAFEWVSEALLREYEALPDGLPMVAPVRWRDVELFSLERAHALGLRHTDVATTIRDTLAWHDAHGEATAGMDDAREAALLRAWDER